MKMLINAIRLEMYELFSAVTSGGNRRTSGQYIFCFKAENEPRQLTLRITRFRFLDGRLCTLA